MIATVRLHGACDIDGDRRGLMVSLSIHRHRRRNFLHDGVGGGCDGDRDQRASGPGIVGWRRTRARLVVTWIFEYTICANTADDYTPSRSRIPRGSRQWSLSVRRGRNRLPATTLRTNERSTVFDLSKVTRAGRIRVVYLTYGSVFVGLNGGEGIVYFYFYSSFYLNTEKKPIALLEKFIPTYIFNTTRFLSYLI